MLYSCASALKKKEERGNMRSLEKHMHAIWGAQSSMGGGPVGSVTGAEGPIR